MTDGTATYQTMIADQLAYRYIAGWLSRWLKRAESLEDLSRDDVRALLSQADQISALAKRQYSLFGVKLEPGPVDG